MHIAHTNPHPLQIQEKMALRILEEEESRMYDAMYEAERLKKEQR
jgi:hypothetical protein